MRYLYFIILFMIVTISPTFAYLDPGTGSMIVSAIIGVAATLAFVFKGFFFKLTGMFRKKEDQKIDTNKKE